MMVIKYQEKINYDAVNQSVLKLIPTTALIILDVGCGTGSLGRILKEQQVQRQVYGVTYSYEESDFAKKIMDDVWVIDINTKTPLTTLKFDCIIFSHVLEHTYKPEKVLESFSAMLKTDGVIIIALPNILQYKQRLKFLTGNFRYSNNGGLMDVTHFRFFDWTTAQEMIAAAGLKIMYKEANGNFPLFFFRKLLGLLSYSIDRFVINRWPGLFAFQFIFLAKKPVE